MHSSYSYAQTEQLYNIYEGVYKFLFFDKPV